MLQRARLNVTMTPNQLAAWAPEVEALARRVGLALTEVFTALHAPTVGVMPVASSALPAWWAFAKTDGSPVTQADVLADSMLQAGLAALSPGVRIVSEESVETHANRDTSASTLQTAPQEDGEAPFWLIDPLDGTKAFLEGDPNYCICIALVAGGQPVFGLLHAPATATSWWSWHGAGQVWRQVGAHGAPEVLRKRARIDAQQATVRLAVSQHHSDPTTLGWTNRYAHTDTVAMSSALKFCALVEDRLDLYPRPGTTMAWDTAAGHCLVEAAGGVMQTIEGGAPLRYGQSELRNPGFVASFVVDD